MANYDENPYYYPEKMNLEIVGTIDVADSYEFDIFAVWQSTETGKLYYATDAGCSCPSPFEDIDSLDDLTEITELNLMEFNEQLANHCKNNYAITPTDAEHYKADGNKLAWEVLTRLRAPRAMAA